MTKLPALHDPVATCEVERKLWVRAQAARRQLAAAAHLRAQLRLARRRQQRDTRRGGVAQPVAPRSPLGRWPRARLVRARRARLGRVLGRRGQLHLLHAASQRHGELPRVERVDAHAAHEVAPTVQQQHRAGQLHRRVGAVGPRRRRFVLAAHLRSMGVAASDVCGCSLRCMGVAASDAWEPHTSSSRGHSAAGCAAPTGAVAPLTAAGRPSPRLWTGVSAGDRDDHSASIACCWAVGKAVEMQLRGKACSGSVPASLRDSSCTCAWGVARANALSCGMCWRVAPRPRGLAAIRALRALLYSRQHRAARSQSRDPSEKRGASKLWRTEEATSNELVRQPVAQQLLVRGRSSWLPRLCGWPERRRPPRRARGGHAAAVALGARLLPLAKAL